MHRIRLLSYSSRGTVMSYSDHSASAASSRARLVLNMVSRGWEYAWKWYADGVMHRKMRRCKLHIWWFLGGVGVEMHVRTIFPLCLAHTTGFLARFSPDFPLPRIGGKILWSTSIGPDVRRGLSGNVRRSQIEPCTSRSARTQIGATPIISNMFDI